MSIHHKLPEKHFPTASTFSIDIDPFSASSSSSTNSSPKAISPDKEPFSEIQLFDPFTTSLKINNDDPFSVFNCITSPPKPTTKDTHKMSSDNKKADNSIPPLNFSNVDDLDGHTAFDDPPELEEEELQSKHNNLQTFDKVEHALEMASEATKPGNEEEPVRGEPSRRDFDDDDDENEDEDKVIKSEPIKPSRQADFSQSYDTINSLDLRGEDDLNEEAVETKTGGDIRFTLDGVVEDETSTDAVKSDDDDDEDEMDSKPAARPSFTKILDINSANAIGRFQVETVKQAGGIGKRSSLQIEDIKLNYEDNNDDEIVKYEETIDEENDEQEEKEFEAKSVPIDGDASEKNEKEAEQKEREEAVQSTLTSEAQERKPFIQIKRVMFIESTLMKQRGGNYWKLLFYAKNRLLGRKILFISYLLIFAPDS